MIESKDTLLAGRRPAGPCATFPAPFPTLSQESDRERLTDMLKNWRRALPPLRGKRRPPRPCMLFGRRVW
jgi:hypothetical protein